MREIDPTLIISAHNRPHHDVELEPRLDLPGVREPRRVPQ